MKIKKTKNYNQFKKIKGNRPYADRHLKNLIASIASNNLLQYTPIIVNKQMEVIDGQHRLAAAKKLGLEVYYAKMETGDLNDVILINANLRSWTLPDYLESHILLGNKEYKILKEFVDKYHLSMGSSIRLLAGERTDKGNYDTKFNSVKSFRNGTFKVTNLAEATFLAEKILEITPYTEGGAWRDRTFIQALSMVYTKVKPSAFINAVARSEIKIGKKSKLRDYLILFEDIYNFRKSAGRQKFY